MALDSASIEGGASGREGAATERDGEAVAVPPDRKTRSS